MPGSSLAIDASLDADATSGASAGPSGRPTAAAPVTEIVIRPPSSTFRIDLREIWRYRHLLVALVWRNVRVQFDAMHLGFVWAFTRPLLYVVFFSVFRQLSGADTQVDIPYSLYVYSGLIVWYYFLDATMSASRAVARDAGLLSKVYYPRLIMPLVPAIAASVNLAISLVPMIILMVYFGVLPGWQILLLPLVMFQCIMLVLGLGTLFSALSLASRDWDRFLQFALYLGLFISPVIYAPDMIPESVRSIYLLNPMAGTLLAFRSVFFAEFPFPLQQWLYALAFSTLLVFIGVLFFQRAEVHFADKL
jgi:lipopolysaccharide transport system permease protein